MPYIDFKRRTALHVPSYVDMPQTAGELNYCITTLLVKYLADRTNYAGINEVIGVLECCKQEVYRRIASPYEDEKKKLHGDVF